MEAIPIIFKVDLKRSIFLSVQLFIVMEHFLKRIIILAICDVLIRHVDAVSFVFSPNSTIKPLFAAYKPSIKINTEK